MTVTVNGVQVDESGWPNPEVAAVRELLRQRAATLGLLSSNVADEREVNLAIEKVLAQEVLIPTPADSECRRHYEMHIEDFRSGDMVHARHILFQVTPLAPVLEISARAERALAEVLRQPERFADLARELSNCPSGQQGGSLGQLCRGDAAPEFEEAVFRLGATGILRELVKTRFGFHIVAVDRRILGETLPFDLVKDRIAERLKDKVEQRALRQYVSILAGSANLTGVELQTATSPLVQ